MRFINYLRNTPQHKEKIQQVSTRMTIIGRHISRVIRESTLCPVT